MTSNLLNVHGLSIYQIELFQNLMCLPISTVINFFNRLSLLNHGELLLRLEIFDLPYEEARQLFMTHDDNAECISLLVEILSYQKGRIGTYVSPLDIFTVMTILGQGDLVSKARLLFQWFNFSKTGYLTELEHATLISRISKCFTKLKVLGTLDITDDESRHIAVTARWRLVNDRMQFMESLDFQSFLLWIIQKSQIVAKLLNIVNNLITVIRGLNQKASSLLTLQLSIKSHSSICRSFPSPDELKCYHRADINMHICHRDAYGVSFIIPRKTFGNSIPSDIYFLCRKRVVFDFDKQRELYPLSFNALTGTFDSTLDTHNGTRLLSANENELFYTLPSYFRGLFDKQTSSNISFLKVELPYLEPNSVYSIQLYTPDVKLSPFHLETFPLSVPVTTSIKSSLRSHSTPIQKGVWILPSNFNIKELPQLKKELKLTLNAFEYPVIVYSGTMLPISQVIITRQ